MYGFHPSFSIQKYPQQHLIYHKMSLYSLCSINRIYLKITPLLPLLYVCLTVLIVNYFEHNELLNEIDNLQ